MKTICRDGLLLLPALLLAAGCNNTAPDTPVTQPPQTTETVTEPPKTLAAEDSTMPDNINADSTAPSQQNTSFTADAHSKNVEKQTSGAAQILAQMRKGGITADRELALEIYFYTDTEEKASKLAAALTDNDYAVKHGPSASDPKVFSVTGQTAKMKMDETIVVDWARQMCELGFRHDCEFDGWGVNPSQ